MAPGPLRRIGHCRHLGLRADRLRSMAHFAMVLVVSLLIHTGRWTVLPLLQSKLERTNRLVHRGGHCTFMVVLHGTAMETIRGYRRWTDARTVDHVT